MIHSASLKIESLKYQELKSRLQTDFSAVDAETIADTLEGITDLHAMIAAVVRSALVDEALEAGLRLRVDDMKQRLSRLELRASKKRQLALEVMTEVGLTRLEQPDLTASTRAGSPSLMVIAEERIPEAYWLPQPPKLDRQSILRELKRGSEISGVQLSNPQPVLMVRTR
jgi:aspartyl-tRNA synthetase